MSHPSNNIRGHLAWTLRKADGTIKAQGEENNLFTRSGRRSLIISGTGAYGENAGLPVWVVLMDDEHTVGVNHGIRSFKVDTLTPTPHQGITPTVVGYTRTFTGSFGVPSAQRTIRKIGLGGNVVWGSTVSEGGVRGISAYLQLTTPIIQETDETFEFVYRMSLVVNTKKSLRRFNSWTPPNETYRAGVLVAGAYTYRETFSAFRCTWGSHYFVDGGLEHRGAPVMTQASSGSSWNRRNTTYSYANRGVRGATNAFTTANANNNYFQGPIGMFASNRTADGDAGGAYDSIYNTLNSPSTGFNALASHEGQITQVYKHPVGETYAWNVVGSIALSQGNVEVRGPFIPDEHKSPWHWLHWIVIDTSGDTDGGTEGEYHVRRMAWMGYPYPVLNGVPDTTWDPCEAIAAYFSNNAYSDDDGTPKHQIAFDGEFYWLAKYTTGTAARLMRWRAGSNEEYYANVVGDTTRWQPFTQPDANSLAYGVASDGAGSTWLLAPSTVLASQKCYLIDNTKPGRHYQRPSGYVENESPQTFNVAPGDEIHAMFPFTAGDVGKKIRFVNALNGADSTRTITAYNGPYSVDVDGAAFIDETEILWHWVTVTAKATNAWPASCKSTLIYDAANSRLWTMSASGLHYSTDGGATWATIDELNGLSTTLAKSLRDQDGDSYTCTFLVGNGGKLYWTDTNNGVNKYTPGGSIYGGTHERIPIASLAAPPGGYTTGTLGTLVYDKTAPNLTDGDGALWIGQDRVAGRCFWRLACGPTFVGGGSTSYGETSIGGTSGTYLHSSFQTGISMPDGSVYLWSRAYNGQWKRAYFDETTGTLTWVSAGNLWMADSIASNQRSGFIHVREHGMLFARSSVRTITGINDSTKYYYGAMVGAPVTYRYDDVADVWRPFYGSATQFNAKYGTTNGGKRKCHAAWQKLLKGSQPNNIELRFVQAGGAVAPVDEFIAGESFTFGAAFGTFRTNTQDLTWTIESSWADTEHLVETETIKTVTGPGSLKAYYWRVGSSAGETAKPLGTSAYPTNIPEFNASGVNFGWMPSRANRYYRVRDGGVANAGNLPDSTTATYGATSHSQHLIGLDLGAAPPAIAKLQTVVSSSTLYYLMQNLSRTSTDRGRARVYYSDDNAAWTEVPEVRFQLNGASPPDAGYANVYAEHYAEGGVNPAATGGPVLVTFDLLSAGLSTGARTHRYWQIHIGNNGTTNATGPGFGGVWATDSNGVPLGLAANNRIDEAHDNDLGICEVTAIDFIQTRTGLSGQGGVNTVDDGDADGRTNIVTIASGTFDTGVISTVTDYLAWKESPGIGNGYVRQRYGAPGAPGPWTTGKQARSRIIAVTSTQITVADDIIPDGLSAADFEIRRPATGTVLGPGTMPWWDRQTGYMQFDAADLGREFRVTRKAIIRLP